jgi:hypothetical protein
MHCPFNRWQVLLFSCPLLHSIDGSFLFLHCKVPAQSMMGKIVYLCLSVGFLYLFTNAAIDVDCCFEAMHLKCRSTKCGTLEPPSKRGWTPNAVNRPCMPGEMLTRYNKNSFNLSEVHQSKVHVGVKEVNEILKLQKSHNNIGLLTGGIPLACKKMQSYGKHYESLKYFFGHISDFESLLILQNGPLQYYPSMKPTSIILHHRWKVGASRSLKK